ncbi:MAG: polysaccharide deacetylase family protein [Bacteroidetes bacterium]|nr:polysaccharide deacetylase family protein [Bacteroidota bacterium]
MNILYLLSQVEITGAETYVESLANYYSSLGHKIFIASDTFSKKADARIFSVPLHQRDFKARRNNILEVRKIIRENNIDIAHANSRASAWVGHFACKRENIPYVVSVHGLSGMRFSKKLVPALGDKTIAVSEYLREITIKDFGIQESSISLVRNGFNFDEVFARSKGGLNVSHKNENDFLLTYIGRATGPKKDIVLALINEIVPEAKKKAGSLKFLLLCPGKLSGEVKQSILEQNKKAGENYIVSDEHKNDVMVSLKQSDLVIAAGRSAIEGAALDKPVLFWGESLYGGLLNDSSLKRALETNFGDSNKAEKVDNVKVVGDIINAAQNNIKGNINVKEKILEEYSLEANAEKVLSIYKEEILKKNIEVLKKPLPILLYHRVVKAKIKDSVVGIFVTEETFDEQLAHLKKNNFKTITFFDIHNALNGGKLLSEKNIVLTFDDGYEDNFTSAFPLLKKYNYSAVIFLVTGKESNSWDESKNEPGAKLLSKKQIIEMYEQGIEFGAHTLSHAKLTEVSTGGLLKEIYNSKIYINKELGLPVISFAYPYGECNKAAKDAVKSLGFEFGVATDSGSINFLDDLYQIRRQIIFSHTSLFQFRKKISKWYPAYKKLKSKK